jgi:hypothetical protein
VNLSKPERFLNYTSTALLILVALYFAMRIGVTIGEGRVPQIVVVAPATPSTGKICDDDGNCVIAGAEDGTSPAQSEVQ